MKTRRVKAEVTKKELGQYLTRELKDHLALSERLLQWKDESLRAEGERLSWMALGQAYAFEQVLNYLNLRRR